MLSPGKKNFIPKFKINAVIILYMGTLLAQRLMHLVFSHSLVIRHWFANLECLEIKDCLRHLIRNMLKSIAFQMLAPKIGEFGVICCVLILRFCASRAGIEHADLNTFDIKDTVRDII